MDKRIAERAKISLMLRSNTKCSEAIQTTTDKLKKKMQGFQNEHCQVRIRMDDTAESSSRISMNFESCGVRVDGAPDLLRGTPQKNWKEVPSKLSLHRPKFKKVVDALTAPAGGFEKYCGI